MIDDNKNDIAIVVAGGSGKRMGGEIPKQFTELCGRPVLYYCLKAYEESRIDKVVLVCANEYIPLAREIMAGYGLHKTETIIPGGRERYDSVYAGLLAVKEMGGADYVQIHDAARPMVTADMIDAMADAVREDKALVAAVPAKDTVKKADVEGFVIETPRRKSLWSVQTPQVFSYTELMAAYEKMMEDTGRRDVTDDASVIEKYGGGRVRIFEASYDNLKLTTPGDMILAKAILESRGMPESSAAVGGI